ncbi:hypothetical protein M422DRAFT_163593 [Sphaerobolus stellatus SS14]|nr:hypothetical protein M422DRAFT_163593 [Sphaerobolus stellatus SS14]
MGKVIQLRLCGIIYYASGHFTCRIISQDSKIYYNDGVTTGLNCVYEGKWVNFTSESLWTIEGKRAVALIYIR